MFAKYLSFSLSIAIISWIVGMIVNALISKSSIYQKLSNLNFIKSVSINKAIGLTPFKWVVKNTFFKYFNQKLKIDGKIGLEDLLKIRSEMTIAEVSHLMAFVFAAGFALVKVVNGQYLFALVMTLVNILMNIYPSLLQQENKRRLDRLIKLWSR